MSVLWRKVWYDLWHAKARTLLVVLSVATGVFSVGAIFGMNDQLLSTMDAAHQATRPSHVIMYLTESIDHDIAQVLERLPGVAGVELTNIVSIRWKLRPHDDWSNGNLLMRDDYEVQRFDLLQLREGEWPQGSRLGIERMHSPFYGIDIGDEVILDVGGRDRIFIINGKIRHPFVPPPSMYDLAWFFADAETFERFGVPVGQFSRLQILVEPYSPQTARDVATTIKDHLAKQGVTVSATQYQDPEGHWGRAFMEGLTMVMQILAVISLLLSAVLVLNTLTATITQQTNQIGILKAVGARRTTIARIYLTGVLFYSALSLGLALPLGVITAFGVARAFLALFNIDYDTFTYSRPAVMFQVIAGLVVPLVAAFAPVLRGAGISVRQAIATYGLGGDFGSNWFDQAIERLALRRLPTRFAAVISNIFRRKGRLVLTQLVLVIAGVMFLMVMSLSSSLTATLNSEFGRRTHDLLFQFEEPQRIAYVTGLSETLPGVVHSDMWVMLPVTILQDGRSIDQAGLGIELQGVPVDDALYQPQIVAGRWLRPGDTRAVVMSRDTAEDENIHVGDWLTLDLRFWGQHKWQVVGLYKSFIMFGGGFSTDAIFAPRPAVFAATHKSSRASVLLVRTLEHSAAGTDRIADLLTDLFNRRNLEVAGSYTITQLRQTADSSFAITLNMLMFLAAIMGIVGGIGLMGSLSISVVERTKEIGVLRAVGGRSRTILGMFLFEGILQGLMAWAIAVPLSMVVSPVMANALAMTMFSSKMDYQYNLEAALVWLAATLIISALASLLPARSATRISVRQSLAYE